MFFNSLNSRSRGLYSSIVPEQYQQLPNKFVCVCGGGAGNIAQSLSFAPKP